MYNGTSAFAKNGARFCTSTSLASVLRYFDCSVTAGSGSEAQHIAVSSSA